MLLLLCPPPLLPCWLPLVGVLLLLLLCPLPLLPCWLPLLGPPPD